MKRFIKRYFILVVMVFVVTAISAKAQPEDHFSSTAMATLIEPMLTTGKKTILYPRSLNGPYDCAPMRMSAARLKMRLRFKGDEVVAGFNYAVSVRVKGYRTQVPAGYVEVVAPTTLTLSPSQLSTEFINDLTNVYNGFSHYEIEILSANGAATGGQVEAHWQIEETLHYDVTSTALTASAASVTGTRASLSWTSQCPKARRYIVEIVRVRNVREDYENDSHLLEGKVFWKSAQVFETTSESLDITVSEGTGYYAFRIRAIGDYYVGGRSNSENYGAWHGAAFSEGEMVTHTQLSGNSGFYFEDPSEEMNRSFHRSYQADRSTEGAIYANGLLQPVQQQVRMESNNKLLVSQTLYNEVGEVAIKGLTTPIDQHGLGYVSNLLTAPDGSAYGPKNFDRSANRHNPDAASGSTASWYQSQYPFNAAAWDVQGRLTESALAGEPYRMGAGHTTRKYYVSATQSELNRYFGEEAPRAESVRKLVVVNANGAVTVSYVDGISGGILASGVAITGKNAGVLDPLPHAGEIPEHIDEMIASEESVSNFSRVSTKPFFSFPEQQEATFTYTLHPKTFEALCAPAMTLQQFVDYQGKIEILNEKGQIVHDESFSFDPFSGAAATVQISFDVPLQQGIYQVVRNLKSNTTYSNTTQEGAAAQGNRTFVGQYEADARLAIKNAVASDPKLAMVNAFLDAGDLQGLYSFIGNVLPDEQGNYPEAVSLSISSLCEPLQIPVQICEDPCAQGVPDFQTYLTDRWGTLMPDFNGFFFSRYTGAPAVPGGFGESNGDWFNQLISQMISDGYNCGTLWQEWKALVDHLDQMGENGLILTTSEGGQLINEQFDLLHQFLQRVGTRYMGYSTEPSDYLLNAHLYFYYDGESEQPCHDALGFNEASPWPQDPLRGEGDQLWATLANCVASQGEGSASYVGQFGGQISPACASLASPAEQMACILEMKAQAENECQEICESRYGDILLEIVQQLLADGFTVQADPTADGDYEFTFEQVNCMAQKMVAGCKSGCSLTLVTDSNTGSVVQVGTNEEIQRMQMWFADQIDITLENPCPPQSSPSDFAPVPGITKELLENHLNQFLITHPAGGCWPFAQVIDFPLTVSAEQSINGCGPGSVWVDPSLGFELTVNGCQFFFQQKLTTTEQCVGNREQFVQLLNDRFMALSQGQSEVLTNEDFPAGISFRVMGQCFLPSALSMTKLPQGQTPRCNTKPEFFGFEYPLGTTFSLAADHMSILVFINGLPVGDLCFDVCCNESVNPLQDIVISSVNNEYACSNIDCPQVCFTFQTSNEPQRIGEPLTCEGLSTDFVRQAIESQLAYLIEKQVAKIAAAYLDAFESTEDELQMKSRYDVQILTRTWYDRAGNRIRTVTPKGYVPVESESRDELPDFKDEETIYSFNSLQQNLTTKSPDGGVTKHFYDAVQRLRFSQTQVQQQAGEFSYIKYDALGKMREQGVASAPPLILTQAYFSKNAADINFPAVTDAEITDFKEVVRLYYNVPCNFDYAGYTQDNLEGSLSCAVIDHDGDMILTPEDQEWEYYSYDAGGKVQWMAQRNSDLTTVTEYEYSTQTAAIEKVKLNPGRSDAFYHWFIRDEDNRVTAIKTSRDGVVWSADVQYQFRDDGKLAVTTLGEHAVKSLNYQYTINGWLKTMTDNTADNASGEPHSVGYTMTYNVDENIDSSPYTDVTPSQTPAGSVRNLYDGTPSVQIIKAGANSQARKFAYDAAGRLTRGDVSQWNGNAWTSSDAFRSAFQYDDNGNLTAVSRNGNDPARLVMDDLSYHYKAGKNQLDHIVNASASGNPYANHMKNQHAGNYQYDGNGQLIEDKSKGANYVYTSTGKPAVITMADGTTIDFRYDAKDQKVAQTTTLPTGNQEVLFYAYSPTGSLQAIYKKVIENIQGGNKRTRFYVDFVIQSLNGKMGIVNGPVLHEQVHASTQDVSLKLSPFNSFGAQHPVLSFRESALTNGNYKWWDATEAEMAAEGSIPGVNHVRESPSNPTSAFVLANSGVSHVTEPVRHLSTATNSNGKTVLTAAVRKLNANIQVSLYNENEQELAHSGGALIQSTHGTPIMLVRKPKSEWEYYLITQLRIGNKVQVLRSAIDLSKAGNGTIEMPQGEVTSFNDVLFENVDAKQYGGAIAALENLGQSRLNRIIFLRHDPVTNDIVLTGHLMNENGSVGASQTTPVFKGVPLRHLSLSSDGKELLVAYRPDAGGPELASTSIRIFSIGTMGELSFKEEISNLSKDLTAAAFSPNGKFIYWAKKKIVNGPIDLSWEGAGAGGDPKYHSGLKYEIHRTSRLHNTSELIAESPANEIFNGETSIVRDTEGRMIISAGAARGPAIITNPDAKHENINVGFQVIPSAAPGTGTFMTGSLAIHAHDRGYRSERKQGSFSETLDDRAYQIPDHLGNVIAVIGAIPKQGGPDIFSARHFYPYGSEMPGVSINSDVNTYRFGFGDKEKDPVTGNLDFHARRYDPRVGQWLSVDPLAGKFPNSSPYVAMAANPIAHGDPDGNEPRSYQVVQVKYEISDPRYRGSLVPRSTFVLAISGSDVEERAIAQIESLGNTKISEVIKYDRKHFDLADAEAWVRRQLAFEDVMDGGLKGAMRFEDFMRNKRLEYLILEPEVLADYEQLVSPKAPPPEPPKNEGVTRRILRAVGNFFRGGGGSTMNTLSFIIDLGDEVTAEEMAKATASAFEPILVEMAGINQGNPGNPVIPDKEWVRQFRMFQRLHPECIDTWWIFESANYQGVCKENYEASGFKFRPGDWTSEDQTRYDAQGW